MDPIARAMFMGSAGVAGLPEIGDSYEGGFVAGYISQNADGVATHGLIVAPSASGYNGKANTQFKTSNTSTSGTTSVYDGAANTANMSNTDHPAANYCAGLSIGGYSDWYLPAWYELEIAYYNLKPTTTSNDTSYGTNSYAVPARASNYTTGDPAQTSLTDFQESGGEDFVAGNHWTSTESGGTQAMRIHMNLGTQVASNKTLTMLVRAFRKFSV